MINKITELTPEQTADLAATREKWLSIGLSTETIDREAAKVAVSHAYECVGLTPPKVFIFLDSPRQGAIAAALLKGSKFGAQVRAQVRDQVWAQVGARVRDQVGDQVGAQVGARVRDQVGDQVGAQVRAQVRAQVGARVRDQVWAQVGARVRDQVEDQVGAQVGAQVRAQVGAQVWAQVRAQVGAQVRAQVWAQVGARVRDQVEAAIYGSHDAGWLGFYEFFNRHFALAEKATCLFEVSRSCGWVWPFVGCAIITGRPSVISFDDQKLLHSETGPAIAYRDGFAVHAWHGVRIPAEWIEDKASLTPKVALTWENTEQRRVAMQIVGWANILRELGARVIDDHADPETGTLVEVDLPGEDDEKIRARFLHVLCGTKREFALGVPPDTASAEAAQAWLFGETTYQKPEVRT